MLLAKTNGNTSIKYNFWTHSRFIYANTLTHSHTHAHQLVRAHKSNAICKQHFSWLNFLKHRHTQSERERERGSVPRRSLSTYDHLNSLYADKIVGLTLHFLNIFCLILLTQPITGALRWGFSAHRPLTVRSVEFLIHSKTPLAQNCLIYVFARANNFKVSMHQTNFNSVGDFVISMLFDFNFGIVCVWRRRAATVKPFVSNMDWMPLPAG